MKIFGEIQKQTNAIVWHDRNIAGPTGRLISKKVLKKACESNCYYKNMCPEFLSDYKDKEILCYDAWKLTIGKGKKVY